MSTPVVPARPPAILLMGPTACGKTDLAVALAAVLPVEVISVDSALVYRGMDIGTAKPDAATRTACPHHLVDIVEPVEAYSAGRFRAEASALMEAIVARGRIPLLVGGTMLYFKALKEGIDALPVADPAVRARIDAEAAARGWPALHAELARVDPQAASRIHARDAQRIQRALEVWYCSGRPISDWQRRDVPESAWRWIEIALVPGDRAALHARIERRFQAMLDAGLVDELAALRARYPLTPDMPAMRCVGYRQAWDYLDGQCDLDTLRRRGTAATRQLAKRQLTWLRGWQGAREFDCMAPDLYGTVLDWLRVEGISPSPPG